MKVKDITQMSLFIALITAGAYIRIPVPVCPFTLQFLFTTLAGILLGSKRGALSVAGYVALGLLGVPVFTEGGGLSYVLQPTFGYLLGFILGTSITGTIAGKGEPTVKRLLIASFAGLLAVYALGMGWYWVISKFVLGSQIGLWQLFLYCFILAVPGDIFLCIISAVTGRSIVPVLRKNFAI